MDNLQGLTAATSDVKKQFGSATKVQFVFRAGFREERVGRERERERREDRDKEQKRATDRGRYRRCVQVVVEFSCLTDERTLDHLSRLRFVNRYARYLRPCCEEKESTTNQFSKCKIAISVRPNVNRRNLIKLMIFLLFSFSIEHVRNALAMLLSR